MRIDESKARFDHRSSLRKLVCRAAPALLMVATLGMAALAGGCSGFVAGQNTQPSLSQTYNISGTITPITGGSGATVTLSGTATATATADSSGNFSFTGLANGSYAVTPSHAGYAFSPTSQNATINGANVTGVNFTAAAQQAHSVALTWNASTCAVAGYNVYRSTVSGSQYAKVNSSLVSGLTYTDTTVASGLYYYVTTAVDASGNESAPSNEASANVP